MDDSSSRTKQSVRNVLISVSGQIMFVLLGFVTRTIFIAELGVAILGVNSLITSVLAMLALADLGINGAFMFALFGPLRDGDDVRTASIVHYAGKLYRRIALIVFVLGLALTPLVHKLVRLETAVDLLELYFLVLLVNTAGSYLMQSRVILLNADQKIYITKAYAMFFNTLRSIAQIIALLLFGNFLVFLVIQVIFSLVNNIVVYYIAGKRYPYLKIERVPLAKSERRSILSSTTSMMIYRVGILILNQATSVFISVLVGTLVLGYYSNYLLFVGAAVMITEVAFAALTPSIGNLFAGGDREAKNRVFDSVTLLSVLVHGIAAVAMFALVDDFIELWFGPDFTLPLVAVACIMFNFYIAGTIRPMWSFLSATGVFRKTRIIIFFTVLISILLALVLGNAFGLAGIVISPPLAQLATQSWFEPWILMKDQLSRSVRPYFRLQLGAFILWSVIAISVFFIGEVIPGGPLASLWTKVGLLSVLLPLVSWVAFRHLESYRTLQQRLKNQFRPVRDNLRSFGRKRK